MAVPEIRARALDEFARTIDVTAAVLARRSGPESPTISPCARGPGRSSE